MAGTRTNLPAAGTNAMAGLVTRGCGEMRRLAIILGGKSHTLSGLSGVGDTFGTCFGPLSRNRNFGIRLGKGESMEEILASSTEVCVHVCAWLWRRERRERREGGKRTGRDWGGRGGDSVRVHMRVCGMERERERDRKKAAASRCDGMSCCVCCVVKRNQRQGGKEINFNCVWRRA